MFEGKVTDHSKAQGQPHITHVAVKYTNYIQNLENYNKTNQAIKKKQTNTSLFCPHYKKTTKHLLTFPKVKA